MVLKSKILKGSLVIGSFSFLADLVALLRDRILTSHFGASRALDIYYSAFKLPDLVFNLLVLGAVSSAFIPVFIGEYQKSEPDAWRLARNFTSIIFGAVLTAAAIFWIFAGSVVSLIAPGFSGADRELAITLTRIMLLSPILFSLSTIFGSVLQSLERFWAYAIAPVLYNAGIIIGAVYFVPLAQSHNLPEVLGLGWGVVLGAAMHFILQATAARVAGFKFKFIFDFADNNFRKIFRLMVPRTLGLGAYSIDSVVVNAIASTMAVGSIAVLSVANNLQFVPISVVGVAVATAVFPHLSRHASAQESQEFRQKLNDAMRNTALIIIPLSAAGYFLSRWGINLLFGIGLFRGTSVDITAAVLSIFMFGIPAQSLIPILSRAFYSLHNTKTPVAISMVAILANWLFAWLLALHYHWGVSGLAWAFSISGNLNFLLLYAWFKKMYF